ncbi:MAG: hypothetical protein J0L93_08250 [Deltaproteobacteria bacterium]|nr:hypothetical protein [Deltaproteobacteria bacterium]
MHNLLLFLVMTGASAEPSILELGGTPGVKFFGVCVSDESGEQKEISGVTPSKIYLDINIRKCSIEKKDPHGVLKIRLFHSDRLVTDKILKTPSSGIELVLPFF